jgi:hypothetical protein
MNPTPPRSSGGILGDTLATVSSLIRNEITLARAEISQNVNHAAIAIGLIAGALVVALVALNVLAAALVVGLTGLGLDAGWASLVVGGGLAVIAFAMVAKGTSDLKLSNMAPTRTAENLKRDAQTLKETYNDA